MAERQIEHQKSSLVLSARFPVVKWRSRPVAKSAYFWIGNCFFPDTASVHTYPVHPAYESPSPEREMFEFAMNPESSGR